MKGKDHGNYHQHHQPEGRGREDYHGGESVGVPGRQGEKTLLIDEDSQGNSTSGLSRSVTFDKSLYDVLLNDTSPEEAVVKTAIRKLHLLPASIDLAGAEIEIAPLAERESLLKRKSSRSGSSMITLSSTALLLWGS